MSNVRRQIQAMWAFPSSKKKQHQLRFRAAVAALLSEHVFSSLPKETQVRVDLTVVAEYRAHFLFAWWMRKPDVSPDVAAIDRAYAMARLGVPTGVQDLPWTELLSPRNSYFAFLANHRGSRTFSRFHPATDEAIEHLRKRGVALSDELSHGHKWLQSQRAPSMVNRIDA